MRSAPRDERHRDDHRQQLGREADRQRQREQKRLEPVAGAPEIDQQHEKDQEPVTRTISMPKRRVPSSSAVGGGRGAAKRDLPELWLATSSADEESAVPLTTELPMNTASSRPGSGAADTGVGGVFLGGEGLAGQQRLVDEEVADLEQPPIGRHEIAGGEQHHSPGTSCSDRAFRPSRSTCSVSATEPSAVPPPLGAMFLDDVEHDAD